MAGHDAPRAVLLAGGGLHVFANSQTGATHLEKNLPCQDACMAALHFYKGRPYTVVAVADGHGSKKYRRSEVGAHLAMEAVQEAASQLVQGMVHLMEQQPEDWSSQVDLKYELKNRFAKTMISRWHELVRAHAATCPEELSLPETGAQADDDASEATGADAEGTIQPENDPRSNDDMPEDTDSIHKAGPQPEAQDPVELYGTTVAAGVFFDQLLMIGVIGDSSVYRVHGDGQGRAQEVRKLLPEEQDGVGLGTDSLISRDAAYAWQVALESFSETEPGMVLLTTDGLTDSLENLEPTIRNIYEKTVKNGMDWLGVELPRALQRWSDEGVGDDMAVVAVFFGSASKAGDAADQNRREEAT
jgi:serine/threonine protein phosphatase PrpC